jgi:large subunit ribosomal protein L24
MAAHRNAPSNKVPEIRAGDTVVIMHGKDAGKRGKVERVLRNTTGVSAVGRWWRPKTSRPVAVVISGINIAKRHSKPQMRTGQSDRAPRVQQGGIIDTPLPIDASNVMIVCPRCDRVTRVKHDRLGSGEYVRVCGHCREQLEAGA